MKITPDDELFRANTVWLGPIGFTLPWTARYNAYAVWLALFLLVLLGEAVTPLTMHIPPIWEICITTITTYAVMGFVSHERSMWSLTQTLMAEVRAPRPADSTLTEVIDRSSVPSHARPQIYTRSHL